MSSFSFYTKWIAFFHSLGKPRYSKIAIICKILLEVQFLFGSDWNRLSWREFFLITGTRWSEIWGVIENAGSNCNPFSLTMLVYCIILHCSPISWPFFYVFRFIKQHFRKLMVSTLRKEVISLKSNATVEDLFIVLESRAHFSMRILTRREFILKGLIKSHVRIKMKLVEVSS